MNFTIFNKFAVCVIFGTSGRYALIPYIEYDMLSEQIFICFWKWQIVVDAERIEEGGGE